MLSVVLPVCNENPEPLAALLRAIHATLIARSREHEIILVDDGSREPVMVATDCAGYARVVRHRYNMGNGAAIKTGVRQAKGDVLVTMDADGQHQPADIPRLLACIEDGDDMAVGARGHASQASTGRLIANSLYNRIASWMVGRRIHDLTSGFRAVRAARFREFLHLLPNGFSYPTTITMAFFRAGYAVAYVPIEARRREGSSHIRPLRDFVRFFLIIFRVGTLYSPLKLFFPVSLIHLLLGVGYYVYTYSTEARLSAITVMLVIVSVFIFLIGLVSEQITSLIYSRKEP